MTHYENGVPLLRMDAETKTKSQKLKLATAKDAPANKPKARNPMSERITIPIPQSQFPTKIEVYHNGKLNRHGGVQAGAVEAHIKIPAPIAECEIKITPCDCIGNPAGRGYTYRDENLVPETPVNTDPPVEPSEDDECCGEPSHCSQVTEIVPDAEASVVVERPEVDEGASWDDLTTPEKADLLMSDQMETDDEDDKVEDDKVEDDKVEDDEVEDDEVEYKDEE